MHATTELKELYQHYLACPKVVTDTRKIDGPCLFFALKGPHFNGNKFAKQALQKGAILAVVDDPALKGTDAHFWVEDVLSMLQALATYHRNQFHIPVIAITGSNGKTTTKELVSEVLGSHYPLHFTKGNLNNHIGVPLTLLAMPLQTEVAVIEMGANHQGEIDQLAHIVLPSHGLITNIGKAHLEGFGGIEGVKKGKSELYRYLAQMGGLAFINREEPFLEELAASVDKKIFYRQSDAPTPNEPDHEIVLLREKPFISVAFLDEYQQLIEAHSQLIGLYNFHNITTAVALGKYFKVPASKIKMAIESYHPQNNRSQIINTPKHTIVLDAYNANPTSMEKAMQTFASSAAGTKVAILGDMLELGEASEAEHRKMVELATNLLDQTIFVGPQFSAVLSNGHRYFPSVEALNNWLRENPIAQSSILIKGSRGIQLEKVLTMLAP